VIAATGYRRGLEPLVGHLGVLDENGIPLVSGGNEHPSAPGLFFNGYRTNLSGQLRLMRRMNDSTAPGSLTTVSRYPVVVFDLDGTLLRGTTVSLMLGRWRPM
jgi:hypothetical protein